MKGRVQLRVKKTRWILDVDGKPIMVTRDGRWLRRFATQIRRALERDLVG